MEVIPCLYLVKVYQCATHRLMLERLLYKLALVSAQFGPFTT